MKVDPTQTATIKSLLFQELQNLGVLSHQSFWQGI